MSLRDDLVRVLARDSRFPIQAYAFIFETIEYTKRLRDRARSRKPKVKATAGKKHITGQELCEGARRLALREYGLMAETVLAQWGLRSTSDLGDVVYNLIEAGDLEKTPEDRRSHFDNVFDFPTAFRDGHSFVLDPV